MKKVLVLLLALVAVGGVFAADPAPALTFGMYGKVTATVATADSYAIYTETYLTYKVKDMGLNATVIGAADIFATPRNYKFWYQVCPAAKISAGLLREGPARLASYIDGNGFSTRMANVEAGVLAELTPVQGITAAVFVPVSTAKPLDDLQKSAFGLSFAIPNIATIVSAYRLNGYEFSVGADLKAIKDTTLKAGFKNTGNLGASSVLYGTFGKKVGDLNIGVDADFIVKPAAAYGIEGMVEYTIGSYVLGAVASIDNGDAWYAYNGLWVYPYIKRNFAAGDIKVGVTYNAKTAVIQLPVKFEISF